jgi:hypothetical protein
MEEKDYYEIRLLDLEQLDEVEELARTRHEGGELPNGDPRVDALFRRVASGKGYYAQLLNAYCEPA